MFFSSKVNDTPLDLVRPHLKTFSPYSSARDEFSGKNEGYALLDANENPFPNDGKNRYPSTTHPELCDRIAEVKKMQFSCPIDREKIALGNGSDELIDLLVRIFCEPKKDSICISSPTFGMYTVSASINEISVVDIPLDENFELQDQKILANAQAKKAKILFLCHPNNPTGNSIPEEKILNILENFPGMVVVDEAYIDFVSEKSTLKFLEKFPRLVVLQTFSKMWGLAGVRCGMAFGHTETIHMLHSVKAPYNVNILSAKAALEALDNKEKKYQQRNALVSERFYLASELEKCEAVEKVFPSDCNSVLVKIKDEVSADKVYHELVHGNVIVRNFSQKKFLENCIRISVGLPEENKKAIKILREISSVFSPSSETA